MTTALPDPPNYPSAGALGTADALLSFRDRLQSLSNFLIETDWREFRGEGSAKLNTAITSLRRIVVELEQWDKPNDTGWLSFTTVSFALSNALNALYTASTLASANDGTEISYFYKQLVLCRRYLATALSELPAQAEPLAS